MRKKTLSRVTTSRKKKKEEVVKEESSINEPPRTAASIDGVDWNGDNAEPMHTWL